MPDQTNQDQNITPDLTKPADKPADKPVDKPDIVADFIDHAPEPTVKPETKEPPVPVEQFDPEVHCVDAEGNPILTATGTFRAKPGKRRGRKFPPPPQAAEPLRDMPVTEIDRVIATTGVMIGEKSFVMLLGPTLEFSVDERRTLVDLWSKVVAIYLPDIAKTPLGAAMLTSALIVSGKIMADPQAIHEHLKMRKSRKVVNNAQYDNGHDGKRENNVGQDSRRWVDETGQDRVGA